MFEQLGAAHVPLKPTDTVQTAAAAHLRFRIDRKPSAHA